MNDVKSLIVLGGGTSGWLSAAMLAKSFALTGRDIEVRLIESPNIPTIGVGEGTFPTITNTLHDIGLSEKAFLRECDAVFKQGAKFCNWLYDPAKQEHAYYHPFDPPAMPKGIDLASYWVRDKQGLSGEKNFASSVTVQAGLCDFNLPPKDNNTPEYAWMARYAYHLDAGKLGSMLKKHATEQLGVKHTFAEISDVVLDDGGYIDCLVADDGTKFNADFFVDCSGFASVLLGDALQVPFVSKSQYLAVDHAVTVQVPYLDGAEIPTHTIATAQEAGWIWDIGLRTRRGTGYVYSSKYTTRERAEEVYREYLGDCLPENAVLRHIPFDVGYRQASWKKNCVAIGFSSGFVEPLEATAIAMVEAGVRSLAARFPENREAMATREIQYNRIFTQRWDNIIDFIKLHYCLTKREDTEFWRDQVKPETIPETLQEKLDAWKHYAVTDGDFPNKYDLFGVASWQYILYGLEFKPAYAECGVIPPNILAKAFDSINALVASARQKLPRHDVFLDSYSKS